MTETQNSTQTEANRDDPLNGRTIEDLDQAELQELADRVYEQLKRELLIERERIGDARAWPGFLR